MRTITDLREEVLDVADRFISIGTDDDGALETALRELIALGLRVSPSLAFRFGELVAELAELLRVEEQDTMRPSGMSWSQLATESRKRVDLALTGLIGGGR